jgi:hypothetical protein
VLDIPGFSLHNGQQSIETGIINYNTTTALIEYLRYSAEHPAGYRKPRADLHGLLTTPWISLIVVRGAQRYGIPSSDRGLRILGYAASIIWRRFCFLVLQIYIEEREYRSELSKRRIWSVWTGCAYADP